MSTGQPSPENANAAPSNVDVSCPKTPPQNNSNPLPLANTPPNVKQAGTQPYSSVHIDVDADTRDAALGKETIGYIVGPMPVDKFLELYVPKGEAPDIPFDEVKAREMQSKFQEIIKVGELGMYPEWVRVFLFLLRLLFLTHGPLG
jgi:hypothetical protein